MPQELILIPLTLLFFLFMGGLYALTSVLRNRMDRNHGLKGSLLELKERIPELKGLYIGQDLYAFAFLGSHRFGIKKSYSSRTDPDSQAHPMFIRMKIRETEHDPFHLIVQSDREVSAESLEREIQPDWNLQSDGVFIGDLTGVPLVDQQARFFSLSAVTISALRGLANQSPGPVTIGPDWEINWIGRDAALRLLDQDGVALTQLELQSWIPGDASSTAIYNHLQKMARITDMLEKELPRA
ncbi:MAG: hypothetical protein RH862_03805 [Leptospiraceae bacterium]